MRLEYYYVKRIVSLNIFIQICLFIIFTTSQAPGVLMTLNGLNIGKLNILILMVLGVLEWSNFLILLSLILSIAWIVYQDFVAKDVKVLFLQLGNSSNDLLRCLFIPCFSFGLFFVLNSLFLHPKINMKMRTYLLETVKKSAFFMIPTNKILHMDMFDFTKDVSLSLAKREDNTLYGTLFHKESYKLLVLIHKMHFIQNDLLDINIDNIYFDSENLKTTINCESCFVSLNPDIINIEEYASIFQVFSWQRLFEIFKIFIITLCLSLFIYILLLEKRWIVVLFLSLLYIINLLNSVNLILINPLLFIAILFIILANFIRINRCSSF